MKIISRILLTTFLVALFSTLAYVLDMVRRSDDNDITITYVSVIDGSHNKIYFHYVDRKTLLDPQHTQDVSKMVYLEDGTLHIQSERKHIRYMNVESFVITRHRVH